jgi:hypothetical protein
MKLSQITVLIITLIFCSSAFAQTSNSNIRSADFSNFTYPWVVENSVYPNESFTLKNGELPPTYDERGIKDEDGVLFENVKYSDITGDGEEEAIVFLSVVTGGSSIPGIIYIYTWQNNRPKLIWFRATGDRADGGLRHMYTVLSARLVQVVRYNLNAQHTNGLVRSFGKSKGRFCLFQKVIENNDGIEQINGREGETATLLFSLCFKFGVARGDFAPRHLNR